MAAMRWRVGRVTLLALGLGCTSQLAPGRPTGTDAAVDRAPSAIGGMIVDAAREVGPRILPAVDAAPVFDTASCQTGAQCLSGFCVGGVCCNTSCEGPCLTCSAPGARGTCVALPAGTVAPPGRCPADDPVTCGFNGLCDGRGGCEVYAAGTLCMPSACHDSMTLQQPATCDGLGVCVPGAVVICTPYTCRDGACYADDCTLSPADCLPPRNHDASLD